MSNIKLMTVSKEDQVCMLLERSFRLYGIRSVGLRWPVTIIQTGTDDLKEDQTVRNNTTNVFSINITRFLLSIDSFEYLHVKVRIYFLTERSVIILIEVVSSEQNCEVFTWHLVGF